MSRQWFESVAVAHRRARRRLPRSVFSALVAGAERGTTIDDNVAAFDELALLPITAGQPRSIQLATEVMGQSLSMPVVISPTGVQGVHPDGELALARAAAARGIPVGLSSFASTPLEEVVAAHASTLFQVYWIGDRETMSDRVERAKAAGARGLILTLDWSFVHSRDWGSPAIPQSINLREVLRHAPEALIRPRWVTRWLRAGALPTLEVPNMAPPGDPPPRFFEAYGWWMATPPPGWDDVAWLRAQWDGPFMVKGVMRVDEAQRAVDSGATAISVSNHGGNNLDGAPAPIRVLESIAHAVGHDVEVVMDGGIRRGSDVVKALALGAKAVMLGRSVLWGLAANGQTGVENVLDVVRAGIESTMRGLGRASVGELAASDIVVPSGFSRSPDATAARPA